MFKRLVSLAINVNRITPIHQSPMSNETPSDVKPKKKRRMRKYRDRKYISYDNRNTRIMSDLKTNIHITNIVEKYNCSPEYVAYLMFLHRYAIHEITDVTGVTKHGLLDAYLRY